MTYDTRWTAYLRRIEPQLVLGVGKHLLNGPPLGEGLDDCFGGHAEVGRRKIARLPLALRIPNDNHAKLDSGLGPPSVEGLHLDGDFFTIDVDDEFLPATSGSCELGQPRKPGSVLRAPASLPSPRLRRVFPEPGVVPKPTDQRDLEFGKGTQQGVVVVSAIGNDGNLQRSPRFHGSEGFLRDLEASAKLLRWARRFGAVQLDPEGQGHRSSEDLYDDGENDPVVPPDETGSRPSDMVKEAARPKDVVSPLGAKGVVHHDQDLTKFEGRENHLEEDPGEDIDVELELGEEAIEVALVHGEAGSMSEAANTMLTLLEEPRQGNGNHVRPAAFGESEPKIHHNAEELRGKLESLYGLASAASGNSHYRKIGRQTFFL